MMNIQVHTHTHASRKKKKKIEKMQFFTTVFIGLCVVCAVVMWLQRKDGNNAASGNVSGSCSVLQCVAVGCSVSYCDVAAAKHGNNAASDNVSGSCSVLQCVAVCCSVFL